MSKKIQLGGHKKNSEITGYAFVDEEDFEKLNKYNWHISSNGYAVHFKTSGRKYLGILRMHREIINAPSDKFVDHINGDKLDNRKINLRLATNSQNQANAKMWSTNKSGYRGVSFHNWSKKWIAGIKIMGKSINLGYFDKPINAARAFDKAAIFYRGEFAKTNLKVVVTK